MLFVHLLVLSAAVVQLTAGAADAEANTIPNTTTTTRSLLRSSKIIKGANLISTTTAAQQQPQEPLTNRYPHPYQRLQIQLPPDPYLPTTDYDDDSSSDSDSDSKQHPHLNLANLARRTFGFTLGDTPVNIQVDPFPIHISPAVQIDQTALDIIETDLENDLPNRLRYHYNTMNTINTVNIAMEMSNTVIVVNGGMVSFWNNDSVTLPTTDVVSNAMMEQVAFLIQQKFSGVVTIGDASPSARPSRGPSVGPSVGPSGSPSVGPSGSPSETPSSSRSPTRTDRQQNANDAVTTLRGGDEDRNNSTIKLSVAIGAVGAAVLIMVLAFFAKRVGIYSRNPLYDSDSDMADDNGRHFSPVVVGGGGSVSKNEDDVRSISTSSSYSQSSKSYEAVGAAGVGGKLAGNDAQTNFNGNPLSRAQMLGHRKLPGTATMIGGGYEREGSLLDIARTMGTKTVRKDMLESTNGSSSNLNNVTTSTSSTKPSSNTGKKMSRRLQQQQQDRNPRMRGKKTRKSGVGRSGNYRRMDSEEPDNGFDSETSWDPTEDEFDRSAGGVRKIC